MIMKSDALDDYTAPSVIAMIIDSPASDELPLADAVTAYDV